VDEETRVTFNYRIGKLSGGDSPHRHRARRK
jgi:hypothetical protein